MDRNELSAALAELPLGGLRFFSSLGSTNDEALAWAAEGAPDLSLVVADEQTAGRGRSGRKWQTPAGAALALSLILRPSPFEQSMPARLTGLAALALVDCCAQLGLQARIKWPNDVLLHGRKMAGILVEAAWSGGTLEAAVVGIGVNVSRSAVPAPGLLAFPATSLEDELGYLPERTAVLRGLVTALLERRAQIASPAFIEAWEQALAFRGRQVTVGNEGTAPLTGSLLGLEPDGSLRLMVDNVPTTVHLGEIHLRPMDDKMM